ncbi:MAG TPA: flagellar protein FlgN [Acidovorax sp.]|jgi:flagellar biosynthesis protein FlgN|nr:flagellar protein FlgN [Acidovorax sp.]
MNRSSTLQRLVAGMDADLPQYRALETLLQEQFQAMLRHDSGELEALAPRILASVDTLEQRGRQRGALLAQLLPGAAPATLHALLERLPSASRAVVQSRWTTLEQLVRECKEHNARNGRLIADQQAILQRVLRGKEEDTYAAA